jgi:electron transfer flavoprotein beta subunit
VKILVLIKYSLDVAEIKVDPHTSELRLDGVPAKIGNIDKNVVEAAVQMIEKYGGSLQALTLGPAVAQPSFREVLAMGLDEVTLVEDPFDGQADAEIALYILKAAIEKLGSFDLILCGFASDDGYSFQFAPRLAERLGLPLVSYVRKLEVDNNVLTAERELDDYAQTVSVRLPAVVSIDEEAFPPRRTTLMDALKAKKKPVTIWHVDEDLGLATAALKVDSSIKSASQIGIVVHRKQHMLKSADMVAISDQLIDALISENVLKEGAK